MSDILIESGSFEIESSKPFEVQFTGATDILFPYSGTLVLPAATDTLSFDTVSLHDFQFVSLLHPRSKADGSRIFDVLRDLHNKPFEIAGDFMIFVANDSLVTNFYELAQSENMTISCIPRYIVVKLESGVSGTDGLPDDIQPVTQQKGYKLKDSTTNALEDLRTVLDSTLGGSIYAFDQSGRQTDAYSALLLLGVDKPVTNAPFDNDIKIQFVDVYGNPMDGLQSYQLKFPSFIEAGNFDTDSFSYGVSFSGGLRELKLRLKPKKNDSKDYLFPFHYICFWPGFGFKFRQILSITTDTTIDLIKDLPTGVTQPSFVRLCLFRPSMAFQHDAGGRIKADAGKAIFGNSNLSFFSHNNKVKIFNTGDEFFDDFYATINGLTRGDLWCQANWKSEAHFHVKGSMSLRKINPASSSSDQIDESLTHMATNVEFFQHPNSEEIPGAEPDGSGEIPRRFTDGIALSLAPATTSELAEGYMLNLHTTPGLGSFSKQIHRGFVRPNHLRALKVKPVAPYTNDPSSEKTVASSRMNAYWKTIAGDVFSTQYQNFASNTPTINIIGSAFLSGSIQFELNDNDPADLVIKRSTSFDAIQNSLGVTNEDVYLLLLNIEAGTSLILPLQPSGSLPTDTDVILSNLADYADGETKTHLDDFLSTYTGLDEVLAAYVNSPTPSMPFNTWLLTDFSTVGFDNSAIRQGLIPYQVEELGGLLRTAIAKKIKVKALYWEQFLENITGGIGLERGTSNNEEITALINRNIDSKRGFAFRDRSTRSFGSWHQKSTAIVKKVKGIGPENTIILAYLGGMDAATGRWDTAEHFTIDPERQSGRWYDVQLKIEGNAAIDVLQNFRHRWKAMDAFLNTVGDPNTPGNVDCRPVTTSVALQDEVEKRFSLPKYTAQNIASTEVEAFVQINRTIPPFSCFAHATLDDIAGATVPAVEGELASLASYKKAIADAQKFIFINDQYFFNAEIALDLHNRLKDDEGPSFLVLVLPQVLGENEKVDPLFFKLRERNLHILFYGADVATQGTPPLPISHRITPKPVSEDDNIIDKVAVLSPVNRAGENVYVHSKHLIVDDVWMTIGSANINNRSLTYDMEINAAVVDGILYKGGTALVKNQRIRICQQLLGLPTAYSAILQDPYACFRLFKAIESQKDDYNLRLHPLNPMVKWLDIKYLKRIEGDDAFNAEVDIVADMPIDTSSFNYLILNVLDPDGQVRHPERLGLVAALIGFGRNTPTATATLSFSFDSDCETAIVAAGDTAVMKLAISLPQFNSDGSPADPLGPVEVQQNKLTFSTTISAVEITGAPSNEITIPISPSYQIEVLVNVEGEVVESPGDPPIVKTICTGSFLINPATIDPPITSGSNKNITIDIMAMIVP